ncbi:hypothetical protein P7K49_027532 [Saguinus oedipus]|uniref:Uncharacterized protein n=1 Tax=Saguinus oedipus TaxID=9490 RepID=A0ABQ9U9Q1_SAGOE|nr:hypothetical protein P7K49_027532 [Saguinus oedipus]
MNIQKPASEVKKREFQVLGAVQAKSWERAGPRNREFKNVGLGSSPWDSSEPLMAPSLGGLDGDQQPLAQPLNWASKSEDLLFFVNHSVLHPGVRLQGSW